MKRVLVAIFSLMILLTASVTSLASSNSRAIRVTLDGKAQNLSSVNVTIDGKILDSDVPPLIYKDRTLVPVRFISEALGAEVDWKGSTQEAIIKTSDKTIVLKIDSPYVMVNGVRTQAIDNIPAKLISTNTSASARTMVPLRFVSETLGYEVGWDQDSFTAKIQSISNTPKVEAISFNSSTGQVPKIHIKSDGEMNYKTNYLQNPSRLLIDIDGVKLSKDILNRVGEFELSTGNNMVKSIRATQLSDTPNSEVVRVIVDLENMIKPQITKSRDGKNLTLTFANNIKEIKKETINGKEAIVIYNTTLTQINTFNLTGPDRVVVDIRNTNLNNTTTNIETDKVNQVRLSQYKGNEYDKEEQVVRVVLDIDVEYTQPKLKYETSGDKLILYVDATKQETDPTFNEDEELEDLDKENEKDTDEDKNDDEIKLEEEGKQKIIVIDAGHGGSDPGAISASGKYAEKELVLNVSLKLEQKLKDLGYKVIMTRSTDTRFSQNNGEDLRARAKIANDNNADAFISIHFNSASVNTATGIETYHATSKPQDKAFAKSIQDELMKNLDERDRGVKSANFVVIRESKSFAALTELGFINNPRDESRIVTESYLEKCAQSIANGIHNFFNKKTP